MEKHTKITFHSGLDTIGGTIMELNYDDYRVFLEIGSVFNPAFDVFDGKVNLRPTVVKDRFWTDSIKKINGIYSKEQLEGTDVLPAKKDSKTAVIISHLHLDHMINMGLVSDDVDVYLTKSAQIIEEALETVNKGITNLRTKFSDIEEEINVGEIHIKPFILNGGSYKDYSFFIETPDLKLHYTGDIFVYGVYEENIKKEIKYLNEKGVDILVNEGTTFLPSMLEEATRFEHEIIPTLYPKGILTEREMLDNTINYINSYDGLIVFNVYEREMCHIENWFEFEEKTSRTLVFEPKQTYILNKFFNRSFNFYIPDTFKEDNYPDYLKEVISNNNLINKEDIINNPQNYMVQNTYENILELLDYRNIKAAYLHHSGEPLGSYDPKFANMERIIKLANMDYKYIYNAPNGKFFCHATPHQLLWYFNEVNPKLLVPSHCPDRTNLIKYASRNHFLAKEGITYIYDHELNTLKEVSDEY